MLLLCSHPPQGMRKVHSGATKVLQGASTPRVPLSYSVSEPYALRTPSASLSYPLVVGLTRGIVTLGQLHAPGVGHMGQKQV